MAVDLTLKSTAIANREATPRVLNSAGSGGAGYVRDVYGYLASVTASLSITSVIRLVEVPSNARLCSVKINSGAQTAGKFDIGVYRNNADGGAVVDADLIASAVDCASAVVDTELMGESTQLSIAEQNMPLWEAAGLSADPKTTFDICATVVTTDVTTGTGALGLRVQYAL